MGSSADGGTATRLGRPPRVTAAEIADAALAIGLERATVRNVAERLGMSVPGLYHHVRTREDLLAMAAAHSMGRLPLPPDRGQPWDRWLLEYGRFVYDALVVQPQIIGQILSGSYNTVRMVQHLEGVFTVLTRNGFTFAEAEAARRRLFRAVTGAAFSEVSRRASESSGHVPQDDLRRAAAALGPDSVPLVHEFLQSEAASEREESFDEVRRTVQAMRAERSDASGTQNENDAARIRNGNDAARTRKGGRT
jgi:AcrR family transcriptional regulator